MEPERVFALTPELNRGDQQFAFNSFAFNVSSFSLHLILATIPHAPHLELRESHPPDSARPPA
jgi:hypothetical protein